MDNQWQPIETAPEGTSILVFQDNSIYEAYKESHGWEFPYAGYHGCGCCSDNSDKPTHWMPLPLPPKE